MREGLLLEIEALQERVTYFTNEVERIGQAQPVNTTQLEAYKLELKTVQEKLAAKSAELESVEIAAVTAQEELSNQFENIAVGEVTLTLREMCANEQYYQFLSIWLQSYVGDMAQTNAAVVASYKSQNESLEEQVNELEQYRKQSIELTDKLADMEQRRDAAGAEIQALKEENQRLATDNESLRKQLETKSQTGPTNLNTNLAELAKEIQAKKPGIYNKRWGKNSNGMEVKTHYVAELSATGETIEIPYLEIGRYREETAEEAEKFRAEEAAKHAAENVVQDSPLVTPPPLFPTQGEGDGDGLAEEAPGVAGSTVSREEFQELTARVARLEQSQRIVA